jgi:hypothetical protein
LRRPACAIFGLALALLAAPACGQDGPLTTAPPVLQDGPTGAAPPPPPEEIPAPGPASPAAPPPAAPSPAPAPPREALHAPAGVADCIWAAVPGEIREAVASAQTVKAVADAIKRLSSSHDDRIALAHHCGAPQNAAADPAGVVEQAVEARTLELWTSGQLAGAYGLGADRLTAAWRKAPAEDRARFASWCAQGFNTPDAPLDPLRELSQRLGLAGGDAASLVGYYAGARALFEQLGGTG